MLKFRWETKFKKTEIGEIPKDWEVKRLGEILAKIIKGKNPKKCLGDLPYLTAKYLRGEEEAEEFYNETAGVLVDENEIVIIWDGSNSGEVFKSKKGILASTMCKLLFDEEVANKIYAFYVLKTNEEDIKGAKSGTDDRHVDKEYFLNLLIPLPPLPEQSRIATVLSWFDDLIEVKKRQNEILEKTAMAIFKSWFIDFEPFRDGEFVYSEELEKEIPREWEVKKIGEIAEIIMGQSPPSKFYNEDGIGIPFIQGKGQLGKYTPQTTIFCSCDGKLAKVYDILLTVRAPVGELNLADKEYIIGRGIASIRSNYWPFLFLYFNFNRELLKSLEKGTTYDAIVKEDIENLLIVIPPSHILQSFHSLVEPLFQKIILNQKQIMTLRKIRDTLLPLLVFGKLRVEEV